MGAGILSLGIAGGFAIHALVKKGDYQSDPNCTYTCPSLESANTSANVATGFGIAGLALAGTGTALLLIRPTAEHATASSRSGLTFATDGQRIVIGGRF